MARPKKEPVIDSSRRTRGIASWRIVLLALLGAGLVVVALTVDVPSVPELRRDLAATGPLAPVAFLVLYVGMTLAPLPKAAPSAAAGLLFGFLPGVLLVMASAVLGALVAFGAGRLLGRPAVARLTSGRWREVDAFLSDNGLPAVVVLRLVPLVPFTAVNYAAGLTAIRWGPYTLGTVLGIAPGTAAFVALGAYGTDPTSWPFVAAVAGLLLLSVGGVVYARRRRSGAAAAGAADSSARPDAAPGEAV